MLLQVVADAGNIGVDLDPVGEPDARDLAQRGVGLLGSRGFHLGAYAALLRRALERTSLHLVGFLNARTPDQLIYRRHSFQALYFLANVSQFVSTRCSSTEKTAR